MNATRIVANIVSVFRPGDASIENIATRRYPLSTEVYWTTARRHPEMAAQFVRFSLSQKGHWVAEAPGYYR